ncbi:MAG: phage exclusion protein Lit family protein [Nitrospinae bacterium]|nr:phage exclusion protein Lit family protein [Nitrospinota bacterium]
MPSIDPKVAVLNLMFGVTPERRHDIERLWRKYNPQVIIAPDTCRIALNVTKDRIAFSMKTIDVFWLIGFSGWHAIECYSPHVVCSYCQNQPITALIRDDEKLADVERDYKERRKSVESLISATNSHDISWPPDLPRPSADRDAMEDLQYKTAYDLTCLALGFALFHEFHHVMLDLDGQRPDDRKEEEMKCDVWAREFMTAKLATYAIEKGHSYQEVLRERSMGFALMVLILHDITPVWGHGGNQEYFSLADRLSAILSNTSLPDDDHFWIFTSSLLISVYRQKHIPVCFDPMSPRALTDTLLSNL